MADEPLHPAVERAALAAYHRDTSGLLAAVRAAVTEDRRMIVDVVDVMAGRACCPHQRVLLNRILEIYGREPVEDATLQMPERCKHVIPEDERRGYARAVAILRDDERYTHWWTRLPEQDPAYGYWQAPAREHLADYLETIARDGELPEPSAAEADR